MESLRRHGAPAGVIAAWEKAAAAEEADLGIWPDCWDALRLFLGLDTQWRTAGTAGVPTGLDYAALPAVLAMLGLQPSERLLADLKVIEAAALPVLLARWKR